MSRVFVSHSSRDGRQAEALRTWLVTQDPPLANEIFLDTDTDTGLKPGVRWKNALVSANSRCEAVICLLSKDWESSPECLAEYRTAENLGKQILCGRLQDDTGRHTSEWQHTDLFVDGLGDDAVETVAMQSGPPVVFAKAGLRQLRDALRGAGIAADNFVWPPPTQPDRAPYRGWEPFEELDAGVFFGRDAQIVRALDMLRAMRATGVDSLFVVLGPSGSGKSSFLRAGLLPRLRRDDRHFVLLDIMRPERRALTGDTGLARAIHAGRQRLGLERPSLGDIEIACTTDVAAVRALLAECRQAAAQRIPGADADAAPPTLVLPLDQAEELFTAEAGPESAAFLELITELAKPDAQRQRLGLIVAGTIRTDRYEVMQTAAALAGTTSEVFDDLKPLPDNQFREVIVGPANRASAGGRQLGIAPDLVDQLFDDAADGGDALPLLALTLRRLYDRYATTGELTLASYRAMGGMERVVQSVVDEVLSADPAERSRQLAALRAAFVPWLATINPDNDQPMRRVARYDDLPRPSRALVDAFVEKRLLVKDRRGGEIVVEVALESLLRQWDDLAGWLREERQQLKSADDIERAATAWRAHDDDADWLLAGTRLVDAEALSTEPGYDDRLAQQPARDYLAASRQAENQKLHELEERRQEKLRHAEQVAGLAEEGRRAAEAHAADLRRRSRILRAVLVGTAVVAAVAVVVGLVAMVGFRRATREAHDALAARLDIQASTVFSRATGGSDIRALAETLAAQRLRSDPDASRGAFYTATAALNTTRAILPTPWSVNSVAFSPDGRIMAAGNDEPAIRLWSLADPAHPTALGAPLTDHSQSVGSVAFSPDGRTLASGSDDRTIRLWNVTDPEHPASLGSPLTGHADTVSKIAFSPDGHILASTSADHTIRLWNVADPAHAAPLGPALTGPTNAVGGVAFSPDGRVLAAASFDGTIRLWNVADAARPAPLGVPLTDHGSGAIDVAFSPDGHTLASTGHDGMIRLWSMADPAHPVALGALPPTQASPVGSVAFSRDGHILAVASAGNVELIDVTDPARATTVGLGLMGNDGAINSVAFSRDGHSLATGGANGYVRLWNYEPALPLGKPLTARGNSVNTEAFSPDGHILAAGLADGDVRFWDFAGPDHTVRLGPPLTGNGQPLADVAFRPDGKVLASGGGAGTIRLWNVGDPAHPSPCGAPVTVDARFVYGVAFSPDGKTLASGSSDGTIRLWNVADPAHPSPLGEPLTGHTQGVQSVAFSPDGRTLASAGSDANVRLWDLTDPADAAALGAPLGGHFGAVTTVAFSPDGHTLVSGSSDKTIRLWPTPLDATAATLCSKVTSNVSRDEWRDWISPTVDYLTLCPDLPVP